VNLAPTEAGMEWAVQGEWYYSVELSPGRFTKGREFPNIALTRFLLSRCVVSGQRCLDIGTMEGLIPTLLARRGATEVVAVDALNLSRRVSLVQAAYGVHFDYFGNVGISNIVSFLTMRTKLNSVGIAPQRFGFDMVILSGVLYHVFSPLHVLGAVRSCLREGGLAILETAAVRSDRYELRFNFTGTRYIYGWTDVWFPSLPLLDYLCRFVKLEPIDCVYLGPSDSACPDVVRVGLVCRAVSRFIHREAEQLLEESTRNLEYSSVLQRDIPRHQGEGDVAYALDDRGMRRHTDTGTCDLLGSVEATRPLPYSRENIVLRLGDTA
jgi:SAM-dependent methyltransferase